MNNPKQKKNKTKTLLGILGTLFVLMVIALSFWYLQLLQGSEQIKEDKKTYNQELKDAQFISEIKREKKQVEEIDQFLNSLYVPSSDAVAFIEYIEDVAADAGVELEINTFDIQEKDVSIDLTAQGSWTQNNRFLVMIENLPYYTVINDFSLEADNRDGFVIWKSKYKIKALTK